MAWTLVASGAMVVGMPWVVYPAWVRMRARLAPRPVVASETLPRRVGIVCAVRNGEARIASRIAEIAAQRVEGIERVVAIVDDGSTDHTFAAASQAAAACSELDVMVVRGPGQGKASAINAGVAAILDRRNVDVLVFCDVRQTLPPTALAALLAPFRDPRVGAASGLVDDGDHAATRPAQALYRRFENALRHAEGQVASTIGATGAWHALRTRYFRSLPEGLVLDDVWLPFGAIMAGARNVVAADAVLPNPPRDVVAERNSRIRSLTGNFQLLRLWPALLNPCANPAWGGFMAHRVMRLATPLGGAAIVAGVLAGASCPGPAQPFWVGVATVGMGVGLVAMSRPVVREALREALGAPAIAAWRWARGRVGW